jgi:hypothetical protein
MQCAANWGAGPRSGDAAQGVADGLHDLLDLAFLHDERRRNREAAVAAALATMVRASGKKRHIGDTPMTGREAPLSRRLKPC